MKGIIATITFEFFALSNCAAQDYYDPETDREHEHNANRLLNLDFTEFEIWMSIAAGVLFLLAYWSDKRDFHYGWVFIVLGCLAILPLFLMVLGLAMTAVKYAFFLAVIIGIVYFFLFYKKKVRQENPKK